MSGGVNALANLPCKTDSNGYLLVSQSGGSSNPDKVVLDSTNKDLVLWRQAAKTLQIDSDGAGAALTQVTVKGPIKATSYSLALTTAQPADQTGNATATLKMNGLGAAAAPATITPTSTGRVMFTITGDLTNSTILDGVTYLLVFGTGAAPANGAAAAGTAISATRSVAVAVAAQKQGFSITGITTGLALATPVWYDLQVANVTGGTASISNVTCVANEI